MIEDLKVMLVAGEASGDLHASALVRELRKRCTSVEIYGVGGANLRAVGMETLFDSERGATMGFIETFGTIGHHLDMFRTLTSVLRTRRPNLLVLVDYPEFNLLLARRARRLGIPVFYFIGPQVWAWRKGRVATIRERVDRMGVVFPFEAALYNRGDENFAVFVGHPLLDVVHASDSRQGTCDRHGLDSAGKVLALLPGSRRKEVSLIGPEMARAARSLSDEGWQPVLAAAPGIDDEAVEALCQHCPPLVVARSDTYNVVAAADAAIVTSGTATVETALLGCPMVITYRMAPISYWLAKRLVDVEWIGMPNIVLQRSVFPELIQEQANADAIAAAVRSVAGRREELEEALRELRSALGEPGAAGRAAELALELAA